MLTTNTVKAVRGNDNSVDMDVLVERGRQLQSAAIGDALIKLFSGGLKRKELSKDRAQELLHATGHQIR
jgi:hypothetical protein